VTPIHFERNISKTTLTRDFKFGAQFCMVNLNAERVHKYFPESGRGLGQVTPTIFDIRSNISLKLLEPETSNLVGGFALGMPNCRSNSLTLIFV